MQPKAFPRPAAEVKLFCGVLSAGESELRRAEAVLEELFSPIDIRSTPVAFVWSRYYDAEMGHGILRHFVGFERLADPGELWRMKVLTVAKEIEHCVEGRRRFNLDPGYLTRSSVVVASTKEASYRVYLNQGVYGQAMLVYSRGGYASLEWTYPDYRAEGHLAFFSLLRTRYLEQTRERVPGSAGGEEEGEDPGPAASG